MPVPKEEIAEIIFSEWTESHKEDIFAILTAIKAARKYDCLDEVIEKISNWAEEYLSDRSISF